MRNGNEIPWHICGEEELTFYPTYEEWKQILDIFGLNDIETFYPTYEEWKHMIVF